MNVIVVGFGVVGQLEYKIMNKIDPDIYDKYNENVNKLRHTRYDIAFIAVPTNKTVDDLCDVSSVREALNEVDADIYVIKSTVLPGTCDKFVEETGKHIVFSPEHSGATQHCNNYDYNFTILGGDKEDCCKVIQMYQNIYDGRHKFRITDRVTAETSKYMLNSYLATKVSFCVQYYELCKNLGISYEELRELFLLDDRINPSHTFVYETKPYWDSHCFNKDVPAIADTFDLPLLKSVVEFNENQKNKSQSND